MENDIIYFDNAATTRPSDAALKAFGEVAEVNYGNSSSLHHLGRRAKGVLDDARCKVAGSIGATLDEVVFTSGGTEADNLAIQGVCARHPDKKRVVISAVEHPAIYKTCRMLKKNGYEIVKVPVRIDGSIDEDSLRSAIDQNTALVSFMMVNNETGTVFPIQRIVDLVKTENASVPVHTDAVQALGKAPLDVEALGVDLLTLSAHKIQGIKGCGALYVRKGTELYPTQFGGGQEDGLRSGTEAVPLIAAFGVAAHEAAAGVGLFEEKLRPMQKTLLEELGGIEGVIVNSDGNGVPHIVNISVPSLDASEMIEQLSKRGICISRGAACKSNHENGPSMLMSFGLPVEVADTALRISLSRDNTESEIERFIEELRTLLS